MNRSFRDLCVSSALCLLFCNALRAAQPEPADAGQATNATQAQVKLSALRARIAALTATLSGELAERDASRAKLREAELAVTLQRRKLDQLHAQQAQAERRRAELRAERVKQASALQSARGALAVQVRLAYMIGKQEQLKLLLNQRNTANLARTLTYYRYFAEARSVQIRDIALRAARLQELAGEIDAETATLAAIEAQTRGEMTTLEHARAERGLALAALINRVASGSQELAQLKRDEQAVESLIADLSRVLQDYPVDSTLGFDQLRGKLAWPVQGRIAARYQESRDTTGSGVRWNGVMIEAPHGAKVRAPYFGRVVYADWLQGLGLLLIIGHSGGFMTLYGHAEVLYKSVGDWVAPGDVIAALGDSGGAAPQLYFEIREGRKTVDPKIWLKTSP